jgi:hypothetical protein
MFLPQSQPKWLCLGDDSCGTSFLMTAQDLSSSFLVSSRFSDFLKLTSTGCFFYQAPDSKSTISATSLNEIVSLFSHFFHCTLSLGSSFPPLILAYFPYFEKIGGDLWDQLAVCDSPLNVASQRSRGNEHIRNIELLDEVRVVPNTQYVVKGSTRLFLPRNSSSFSFPSIHFWAHFLSSCPYFCMVDRLLGYLMIPFEFNGLYSVYHSIIH